MANTIRKDFPHPKNDCAEPTGLYVFAIEGGNLVTHAGSARWLFNDKVGLGHFGRYGWPSERDHTNFMVANMLLEMQ
jgi:hypothetical protein